MKIWIQGTPVRIKLKLWWCRLWVRKDEFHWTLDYGSLNMLYMTKEGMKWHHKDLTRRRDIAHSR